MATAKPKVTVIIPAYGNHKLLLETLKSVYNQRGHFYLDVMVVDDHSPVPLKSRIAKSFPQTKVVRNSHNLRSGSSRNVALKNLKTDYVAFLDSDDLWKKGHVANAIIRLEKSNSVGTMSLSSPLFSFDLLPRFVLKIKLLSFVRDSLLCFFLYFNQKKLPQSAFYLCQLSHLVFNHSKIKNLHFDAKYNFGGEDWKFLLEVLDRGDIAILPNHTVLYRYHKKSATQKAINLKNKWNSYSQLLGELKERRLNNPLTFLFRLYINTFKHA